MRGSFFDPNSGATISSAQLSASGLIIQPTPAAKTVATTLTAAEILTGIITANQGGAAAANYQLPLASALETALAAAFGPLPDNAAFTFALINISAVAAEDITITTNTGWTLVGQMTVQEAATGRFMTRRTAANTYTLYRA